MKTNFIFIGRFQPLHHGHLSIISEAIENPNCDRLIILVGSSNIARDIRNPFTFEERRAMIADAADEYLSDARFNGRDVTLHILPIEDSIYNNAKWLSNVHKAVDSITNKSDKFVLTGFMKDDTEYLKYFPQYESGLSKSSNSVTATAIRRMFFTKKPNEMFGEYYKYVPDTTLEFLQKFIKHNNGETYNYLVEEFKFIDNYKKKFANLPYEIPYVTGDAIVTCCGHVLLIRRKRHPGKGLLAIPGGFFKNDDPTQVDTAIRELCEETRINVDKNILKGYVRRSDDFSDVNRSLRGRIITKAVWISLPDQFVLPKVKAADDAAEAMWIPIGDVITNKDQFFEDHYQILEVILGL